MSEGADVAGAAGAFVAGVAEGLFQQTKAGRADAWTWIGAEDEDDELAPEAED